MRPFTQRTTSTVHRAAVAVLGSASLALLPAAVVTAAEEDPRGTDAVCPAPDGDYLDFEDIADDDVHRLNIECLVGHGIAQGGTPTQYAPRVEVRRGAMATFVTNLVETATGESLPVGDPGFDDIEDSVHERNIAKLATAGIVQGTGPGTYDPGAVVERGAMATFLANAIDHAATGEVGGEPLQPPTQDLTRFDDVPGTTHSASILRLEGQRIVSGVAPDAYAPGALVTRAAMATFLLQAGDYLAELDVWDPDRVDLPGPPLEVDVTVYEEAMMVGGPAHFTVETVNVSGEAQPDADVDVRVIDEDGEPVDEAVVQWCLVDDDLEDVSITDCPNWVGLDEVPLEDLAIDEDYTSLGYWRVSGLPTGTHTFGLTFVEAGDSIVLGAGSDQIVIFNPDEGG